MKFFLLGIAMLSFVVTKSQNVVTNQEPLASTDAGRILYRGFDNVVTLSAGKYDNAKVEIRNGRIVSAHGSTYVIVPRPDTTATIIYIKTPRKTYEFVFQLKNIPDPEISVAGGQYMHGVLTGIRGSQGVTALLRDFYYETHFKVESFSISFSGPGFDSTIVHRNEGAAWDRVTTELLDKCRVGCSILIEHALVLRPDGLRRYLPDTIHCLLR